MPHQACRHLPDGSIAHDHCAGNVAPGCPLAPRPAWGLVPRTQGPTLGAASNFLAASPQRQPAWIPCRLAPLRFPCCNRLHLARCSATCFVKSRAGQPERGYSAASTAQGHALLWHHFRLVGAATQSTGTTAGACRDWHAACKAKQLRLCDPNRADTVRSDVAALCPSLGGRGAPSLPFLAQLRQCAAGWCW